MTYTPGETISPHALNLAKAWEKNGFDVILVVNSDTGKVVDASHLADQYFGLLIRDNGGYDFGAWATALLTLQGIDHAALVVTANDSVYGPLAAFPILVQQLRSTNADVIGVTESQQGGWHFQSYLLAFKPPALGSQAFWNFWRRVRAGDRRHAIDFYELQLVPAMHNAGLRCTPLFPVDPMDFSANPTQQNWVQLIRNGFPFVKAELLRKRLSVVDGVDWRSLVTDYGGDAEIIAHDLEWRASRS